MKDIYFVDTCIFARIFYLIFFQGVLPLFNLEIWPKLNILQYLKQFVSSSSLKPWTEFHKTLKAMLWRCAYSQEILIQLFFWELGPF